MLFGSVMTDMMDYFIQRNPSEAEGFINKLSAIEWKNYLTPDEAEDIVSRMEPEAPWSRDAWNKAMESQGFEKEDKPYYNSCSLWVVMNMVYSDDAKSLAKILDVDIDSIPLETFYLLAVDKLKDKDEKFNVRDYFLK